jgi:hypothetical protein
VAGSCEHGNKYSNSIMSREYLDYLNDCKLLMMDSVPVSLVGEVTTVTLNNFLSNFILTIFTPVPWQKGKQSYVICLFNNFLLFGPKSF